MGRANGLIPPLGLQGPLQYTAPFTRLVRVSHCHDPLIDVLASLEFYIQDIIYITCVGTCDGSYALGGTRYRMWNSRDFAMLRVYLTLHTCSLLSYLSCLSMLLHSAISLLFGCRVHPSPSLVGMNPPKDERRLDMQRFKRRVR